MRSSEEWTAPRAEQRIAWKKRQRVDSGRELEKKLEVKDEARAEKDCAPCPVVSGIEGIHWKKTPGRGKSEWRMSTREARRLWREQFRFWGRHWE
jgi:hypothetical protein